VGNLKNVKPKKELRLPFSLVRFFWASKRNEQISYQEKESNIAYGRTNKPTEGSLAKRCEQYNTTGTILSPR
jgi:hypothetical protein